MIVPSKNGSINGIKTSLLRINVEIGLFLVVRNFFTQ